MQFSGDNNDHKTYRFGYRIHLAEAVKAIMQMTAMWLQMTNAKRANN